MDWWGGLITVGAATAAGVGTWLAARTAKKKVPEETAHVLTETALSLVQPLRERVEELEERVEALESEVHLERRERRWRERHADALEEQLHAAGIQPVTLEEIRKLFPNP